MNTTLTAVPGVEVGGQLFAAAYPDFLASLPGWVDSGRLALYGLSLVLLFAAGFAGFRCPSCGNHLTDDDGSYLLFFRVEECERCGMVIDGDTG